MTEYEEKSVILAARIINGVAFGVMMVAMAVVAAIALMHLFFPVAE